LTIGLEKGNVVCLLHEELLSVHAGLFKTCIIALQIFLNVINKTT